jgi:hypothetical protein
LVPAALRDAIGEIPLEQATDMVAERVKKTRDAYWQQTTEDGLEVRRTMAIALPGRRHAR